MIEAIGRAPYSPANGAQYQGEFGRSLQQVARLIKAEVGVEAAFADIGGWDHHSNEAPQLATLLQQFGTSLAAFSRDMGDRMDDIVLVTMSEFGRTVKEDGNNGTDHGHGNVMLVLGGAGRLYGGIIGAAIFMIARDQFSGIAPQFWYFWIGLLLVGVVMFLPNGILGGLAKLTASWRERRGNA